MQRELAVGDVVTVTLEATVAGVSEDGVRLRVTNSTAGDFTLPLTWDTITWQVVVPAEWPPQPSDVWAIGDRVYFCMRSPELVLQAADGDVLTIAADADRPPGVEDWRLLLRPPSPPWANPDIDVCPEQEPAVAIGAADGLEDVPAAVDGRPDVSAHSEETW